MKLSDSELKADVRNKKHFDWRCDGNGLYIRYRENETTPRWFFRYNIAGIDQRMKIGDYPDMSLKDARKEATRLRGKLLDGKNPGDQRKARKKSTRDKLLEERAAQTVDSLVDEFFSRRIDGRVKTAKGIRQKVDKHFTPILGHMRVDQVKPKHIQAMLDSIKNAPTQKSDILSLAKRIFNHGIKLHLIEINPANAFDTLDAGGKEVSRDRYLSELELTQLFKAMRESTKFSEYHYQITKLLLLLGVRKSELLKSKRAEFDLINNIWHMPKDNKTNLAINIPLSKPAQSIIKELLKVNINEYLIPAQGGKGHVHMGLINEALQNVNCNIEHFVLHDFRSTMRTHLGKMGIDRFVAERCLNHVIPGMQGVYDAGDYFKERKAALELWAGFVESCEAGGGFNVVAIGSSCATQKK